MRVERAYVRRDTHLELILLGLQAQIVDLLVRHIELQEGVVDVLG